MKTAGVVNILVGVVMIGLAVAIPIVTGNKNMGYLIGMYVGLGGGGLACLGVGVILLKGGGKMFGRDPLLATGIPATAVIKGVQETGITLQRGMFVILNFNLEVGPGTSSPYQVTCRSTVPRIALGMVGVGKLVAVKVDPANRNHIAIDWNAVPA